MNGKVVEIRTDEALLRALTESSPRKPTAEEALEQRVSFVYGSMKSDSDLTREQVKKIIVEQEACAE